METEKPRFLYQHTRLFSKRPRFSRKIKTVGSGTPVKKPTTSVEKPTTSVEKPAPVKRHALKKNRLLPYIRPISSKTKTPASDSSVDGPATSVGVPDPSAEKPVTSVGVPAPGPSAPLRTFGDLVRTRTPMDSTSIFADVGSTPSTIFDALVLMRDTLSINDTFAQCVNRDPPHGFDGFAASSNICALIYMIDKVMDAISLSGALTKYAAIEQSILGLFVFKTQDVPKRWGAFKEAAAKYPSHFTVPHLFKCDEIDNKSWSGARVITLAVARSGDLSPPSGISRAGVIDFANHVRDAILTIVPCVQSIEKFMQVHGCWQIGPVMQNFRSIHITLMVCMFKLIYIIRGTKKLRLSGMPLDYRVLVNFQ